MNSKPSYVHGISFALILMGGVMLHQAVQDRKDAEARFIEATKESKQAREEYVEPAVMSATELMKLEKEAECLATNVYFEARSESLAGQLAVAFVVLNRTGNPKFPETICGVVHDAERDAQGIPIKNRCQFSWYCDGKPDEIHEKEAYQSILAWSRTFVFSEMNLFDFTGGADHFHTIDVSPSWRNTMVFLTRIDRHMFYKQIEDLSR